MRRPGLLKAKKRRPLRNLLGGGNMEYDRATNVVHNANRARDPRVANSSSAWTYYTAPGGAVASRRTDGGSSGLPPGVSTYFRIACPGGVNGSNGSGVGYGYNGTDITVTPGEWIVPSIYFRSSASLSGVRVWWQFFDSTQAVVGEGNGLTVAHAATGMFQRLLPSNWVQVPAGADRMTIRAQIIGSGLQVPVDGTLDVSCVSTAPGDYFDGSSPAGNDWTYVWAGIVNDSESHKRGTVPHPFSTGGGQRASAYVSTEWSSSGTKSARVPAWASNDSFSAIDVSYLPSIASVRGKTLTVIGTVRISKAQSGGIHSSARAFRIIFATPTGSVDIVGPDGLRAAPNVPGVHRTSRTFKVPENASSWTFFRLQNGDGDPFGPEILFDDVMIVEGDYSGRSYTGDSYLWKWDGTPGQSSSIGYPESSQLIRNQSRRPIPSAASGGWNQRTAGGVTVTKEYLLGGPLNSSYQRLTQTAGSSGWYRHSIPDQTVYAPGSTFELSFDIRADAAFTCNVIFIFKRADGTSMPEQLANVNYATGNQWFRGAASTIAPVEARTVSVEFNRSITVVGATFDATRVWVGPNPSEVYSDGDTPGWRWEGAAGASASVGYPYTLESILVGRSFVKNETPNSLVTQPAGPDEGRTLLVVADILTNPTTVVGTIPLASMGRNTSPTTGAPVDSFTIRSNTGSNLRSIRGVTPGGSPVAANAGASTVGRHAWLGQYDPTTTRFAITQDNSGLASTSNSDGSGGITGRNVSLASANADQVPIVAYGIDGLLSANERTAVHRWLANKYGLAA